MRRIRRFSENVAKTSTILYEDALKSQDWNEEKKERNLVKEKSLINRKKENFDNSTNLCNGLYNLIKSEQSIDSNTLNFHRNKDVCGKCKSCLNIKDNLEDNRKSIQNKLGSSMIIGKTNILQSSSDINDNNNEYHHFEFSVSDIPILYGQKIDYYKPNYLIELSDWESDWTYYKRSHQFESYVRRYILHSETPIEQIPDTTLLTGLMCGALLTQSLILLVVCIYNWSILSLMFGQLIIIWRMIRSLLFGSIFIFLISVNLYVWQSFGINHVLIFELDPRSHLKFQKIIKIAVLFGNIWCCSLINFIHYQSRGNYFWIWPLLSFLIIAGWICNPLPFGYYKARKWLGKVTIRTIMTPFFKVNFAEFWIADQLNSLSFVFVDIFNGLYVYYNILQIHGLNWNGYPEAKNDKAFKLSMKFQIMSFLVIKLVIVWFRLGQCLHRYYDVKRTFPHLINGGKYLCSMITIILAVIKLKYPSNLAVLYVFIIASVINTIYAYLWDILMDWKLFKIEKHSIFFRESLYKKSYFIAAVILNGVIRCYWTIYFFSEDEWIISIGFLLEMLRRFIWNFFRVENEHMNNCGNFRAVRE